MQEFKLIKEYFSNLSKKNVGSLNLNDDVYFDKSKRLVISVDTYIEGVHFINFKKPELVIKKVIRSSLSDLTCKGVIPKYYFISASGNKKTFSKYNLKKISKSLKQEQDKFDINLCGGDTVSSNKTSFTIVVVGFSKKIVFRNKARLNDDIYVTGNLGDSYVGLKILKKEININNKLKKYFVSKYFLPDIHLNLAKKLVNFANSSIDISDGLIADLEKLINNQKLSYKLYLNNIPISKSLSKTLNLKRLKKLSFISKGDDYQVLFTASPDKSRIIIKISQSLGLKISKIGKINTYNQKSQIIDQKGKKIALKHKGYYHRF